MGGSKPEWADASDHATLEEVFTSRSFGKPLPESPPSTVLPAPIAVSKLYFGRNRFIASGAAAAAALSVVAGMSSGRGRCAQSVLAAHSSGPVVPGSGSTPTTTIPSQTNSGPAASGGSGAPATGNQSTGASTGPERDRADILGERTRRREFIVVGRRPDADRDPDRGRHKLAGSGHGRSIHYDADDARHPERDHTTTTPRPPTTPTTTTTSIPVSSASGGAAPVGGGGTGTNGSSGTGSSSTGGTSGSGTGSGSGSGGCTGSGSGNWTGHGAGQGNSGDTGNTGDAGNSGSGGNTGSGDNGWGNSGGSGQGDGWSHSSSDGCCH